MFVDGDNEIVLKVLHSQDIISVIVGWFWSFYCDKKRGMRCGNVVWKRPFLFQQ